MNCRSLSVVSFLCLLLIILSPRTGSAQEVRPLAPEWLQQMYAEGWEKVQEGVLRRDVGEGKFETFSYGVEGLQWVIEGYARQISFLEDRYSESPSEELAVAIEKVQEEINKLSENLEAAPSAEGFDGSATMACTDAESWGVAFAEPQESPRGVTAMATADFYTECADATVEFFLVAHTEAIDSVTGEFAFDTAAISAVENHVPGTMISGSVETRSLGSSACYSYAQVSTIMNGDIVFQTPFEEHYGCPLPVLVTITGPETVITDYYTNACADVTWTARATQGTPGYTYEWYSGDLWGTGATLTKRYCNTTESIEVGFIAIDARGWGGGATFATNIQHIGPLVATVSGPSSVTTNSSTPCVNVTWSAGASGAHPGYTYFWDVNWEAAGIMTSRMVTGPDSTLTEQFCNTNASVRVEVTVSDSDGHAAKATKTTAITYTPPPVAASITGPATVVTDYYINNGCTDVTWTASATQGTPGYTYQWYIGDIPQGTGATLTQNYCNSAPSVTVRVVATDTQGGTDDATFTTGFQYIRHLNASVSGPTSVATNSSTPCANVTWTASAIRAHPGYTYSWYIGTGTTVQGTGSTYTKQYCNTSTSVTVRVVARDSDGHTDDATMTTTITHTGDPLTASISGPSSVTTNTSTPCANVTWTASASGAHPGYTYSWYIGTGTTVQGTGSTFTKQYCNTSTSVTVKVVARDSDGHTDDATKTTTITHVTNPPTASISGPATVWIEMAGQCTNITWTASATGGSPGYTYTWYLGTSTTSAGTGSTFTKNFCGAQTIDVKVIARDTAAQTDDATFTTVIRREMIYCQPGQVCQ